MAIEFERTQQSVNEDVTRYVTKVDNFELMKASQRVVLERTLTVISDRIAEDFIEKYGDRIVDKINKKAVTSAVVIEAAGGIAKTLKMASEQRKSSLVGRMAEKMKGLLGGKNIEK